MRRDEEQSEDVGSAADALAFKAPRRNTAQQRLPNLSFSGLPPTSY